MGASGCFVKVIIKTGIFFIGDFMVYSSDVQNDFIRMVIGSPFCWILSTSSSPQPLPTSLLLLQSRADIPALNLHTQAVSAKPAYSYRTLLYSCICIYSFSSLSSPPIGLFEDRTMTYSLLYSQLAALNLGAQWLKIWASDRSVLTSILLLSSFVYSKDTYASVSLAINWC